MLIEPKYWKLGSRTKKIIHTVERNDDIRLELHPFVRKGSQRMLEKPAPVAVLTTSHSSPERSSSARVMAPPRVTPSRQPQPENGTLSPSKIARLTFFGRSIAGSGPRQPYSID